MIRTSPILLGILALISGLGACTQPEWDKREREPEEVIIIEEDAGGLPPEGEQQSGTITEEPPVPEGDTRPGSRIEADVQYRLSFDPDVGDNLIQAEYESGRARLIGEVDSEEEVLTAARIASGVPGVREVDTSGLRVSQAAQR